MTPDKFIPHPVHVSLALSPQRADLIWEEACNVTARSGRYGEIAFIGTLPLTVASLTKTGGLNTYLPCHDIDMLLGMTRPVNKVPNYQDPHMSREDIMLYDMLLPFDHASFEFPTVNKSRMNETRWTLSLARKDLKVGVCFTDTLGLKDTSEWTDRTPTFLPMLSIGYQGYCKAETSLIWAHGGHQDMLDHKIRLSNPDLFFALPPKDLITRTIYLCKHASLLPNATFDPDTLVACQEAISTSRKQIDHPFVLINKTALRLLDSVVGNELNNPDSVRDFINHLRSVGLNPNKSLLQKTADKIRSQVQSRQHALISELEQNASILTRADDYLRTLPDFIAHPTTPETSNTSYSSSSSPRQ